jgi:hypothetical protein
MYVPKTQVNDASVTAFLNGFKEEDRYLDLLQLIDLMQDISACPPKMWGTSIVGFDQYHYKGKSSEGEWFCIGFSPRKQNISIYAISGFEKEKDLMAKLGKYKTGKSCLYVERLSDIDMALLEEFLKRSMIVMKEW